MTYVGVKCLIIITVNDRLSALGAYLIFIIFLHHL